jgi:shikimate dehydrogenase
MIDAATKLYGLLGDPVTHSLSPAIHNAAFKRLGLNSIYLAFKVGRENLKETVTGLKHLGIAGFNVTIPHKTAILPMLDEVSTVTMSVGAANTVVNRNRRFTGYNTDVDGLLASLNRHDVKTQGSNSVIIGAGGFARGAVGALCLAHCSRVTLVCRDPAKGSEVATQLAKNLKSDVQCKSLTTPNLKELLSNADILINATPIGMLSDNGSSPVPSELLTEHMSVIDAVYRPANTKLLKDAKKAGAITISGFHILLDQAAASFRIWTGREPPEDVMRNATTQAAEVLA